MSKKEIAVVIAMVMLTMIVAALAGVFTALTVEVSDTEEDEKLEGVVYKDEIDKSMDEIIEMNCEELKDAYNKCVCYEWSVAEKNYCVNIYVPFIVDRCGVEND